MATLKQIEASRRNGAKSKGPVTPEGKAVVSQNGIKHGIYAQTVVLENEDEDLYNIWRDNHLAEWTPATDTEHNLVIDIVDARWRLRRLSILETKAIDFELGRMQQEVDNAFEEIDEGTRTVLGLNSLVTLNRTWDAIQTSIRTQHRIIDRATAQLLKLGKFRRTLLDDDGPESNTTPAEAGQPDANSEKQTQQEATSTAVQQPQQENREGKPDKPAIEAVPRSRTVFDPTLDHRRRAA